MKDVARLWIVPVALLAWELAALAAQNVFFPRPSEILVEARERWFAGPVTSVFLTDEAVGNLLPSLARMLTGWALAGVVGIVIGIAVGRSASLSYLVNPLIHFGRAVPPPVLLPIFLLIFQMGTELQLATIVFGIIWPIIINTSDGARSLNPLQIDTARVFEVSRRHRLLLLILPAATPKMFAGLRLSLSLALILMIISELKASTEGIGYLLNGAQRDSDMPGLWAGILLLGVLGFLLNYTFLLAERRILAWHHGAGQAA